MGAEFDGLLDELKTLRKGRGVYAPLIVVQVGPVLRELCGIGPDDDAAEIRDKLAGRLGELAGSLPADLKLAAIAAIALHPMARHRFLNARISWLAEQLGRDERTARRRIDDGISQLAEAGAKLLSHRAPVARTGQEEFWVEEFAAVLVLDRAAPEAFERRRIVAERDGIDRIIVSVSLPRDRNGGEQVHELVAEVLYGGTLTPGRRVGESRFDYVLRLPHALKAGERHEYGILFRIPPDQPMREHYVYTSPRRCDLFDLRIRFGTDVQPQGIWRVEGVFHRGLDEGEPDGERLLPDSAGELHVSFQGLKPGFGYGVQWAGA
ncbi:hypothetical protein [Amycolatopsis sp. H20-H5]|uniref:hypothetical protein n=1 Tax=Amycolatopsis sp. H20-H5 TaxID=3046309 RepID=UPI002DB7DBF6|nr:hypothetical protein [Amycolatopsis sp. H20-H5]MEC3975712.1 hypothetical protein [Amycolatopsis sp. H20-H5]